MVDDMKGTAMGSLRQQEMHDAMRLLQLAQGPAVRQRAVVDFVLGCARMAIDLRQMCDARACCSHPVDHLEDAAELIEREITKHFRHCFGHPMFSDAADEDGR